MKRVVLIFVLVAGVAGVAVQQKPVKVDMKDAQGQPVGTVTVSSSAGGVVEFALDLKGLPPGEHAFHVHQVAKCEPPFTTAGPHFNPEGRKHGMENPQGPHAGDMSNILVGPDGTARVTVTNSRVALGTGANSLFANGGTALVIHAKPDDMKTDPAGNAGDRIACGVITK